MEQTRSNFSKQIKQQVVLTLNFLPVTAIRCQITIRKLNSGVTEGAGALQPLLQLILVKIFQDTPILISINSSGHNNSKMELGTLIIMHGGVIITLIVTVTLITINNNHLQRYNHLPFRNKTVHLVIVITRELLIMCNSAKIGQLSDR